MDDLEHYMTECARLKAEVERLQMRQDKLLWPVYEELSRRYDAMKEEVEHLRADLVAAGNSYAWARTEVERLREDVAEEAARASDNYREVKRLRAALGRIADPEEFDASWRAMREVARAALAQEEE